MLSEATIECYCGICTLTLTDNKASCHFQCGCNSCRQKIQFAQVWGGKKCVPLPTLFLMPSQLSDAQGLQHMQAFKLREDGASTSVYCSNRGDLTLPLVAYIWMEDYNDEIGPPPTENVPLFESTRYRQEHDRCFSIPEIKMTFSEPDIPIEGYTFRAVLNQLSPPKILGIQEHEDIFERFGGNS